MKIRISFLELQSCYIGLALDFRLCGMTKIKLYTSQAGSFSDSSLSEIKIGKIKKGRFLSLFKDPTQNLKFGKNE